MITGSKEKEVASKANEIFVLLTTYPTPVGLISNAERSAAKITRRNK